MRKPTEYRGWLTIECETDTGFLSGLEIDCEHITAGRAIEIAALRCKEKERAQTFKVDTPLGFFYAERFGGPGFIERNLCPDYIDNWRYR